VSVEYEFLCSATSVPLARAAHTPSLGLPLQAYYCHGLILILTLLLLLLVFGHSTALGEEAHPLLRAIAILAVVSKVGHVGEHVRTHILGGLVEMFARPPPTKK
jgi:hypothetical protein